MSRVDDEFKEAKDDEEIAGDDDGPGWDVDDEDLDLPDLVSYLWLAPNMLICIPGVSSFLKVAGLF